MEQEHLGLTAAGKRFGLSAFGAGQWVRGYYAFKQAREESDYVHEVDERAYPYFQELFGRSSSPVREWLGWNEDGYKFKNPLNFNEFVGWLYRRRRPASKAQALQRCNLLVNFFHREVVVDLVRLKEAVNLVAGFKAEQATQIRLLDFALPVFLGGESLQRIAREINRRAVGFEGGDVAGGVGTDSLAATVST